MKAKLFLLTLAVVACSGTEAPPPHPPIGEKQVGNILFVEANNVNPLNALAYEMESGELFFDAVVLFSSNVNYDGEKVYVHHNENCTRLFNEAAKYIKPLQEAGIEVYLSILVNHDASGVAQLSTEGARMLARNIADDVEKYGLDGVCFDDEYSKSPDSKNPLFAPRSPEAASRLLYETKKLIGHKQIMIYEYGMLYARGLTSVDGAAPSTFVDIIVPDYTLTSEPIAGLTRANCAGYAVELNLGRGRRNALETQARDIKKAGYGWYMWFGLDPEFPPLKYQANLEALGNICRGLYDRELHAPTYYYKKFSTEKTLI